MMSTAWREDPLRAWVGIAGAGLAIIVGAALAFPQLVYDKFIWQYFWGPVVADAHGVGTSGCAVRFEGQVEIVRSATECATAAGVVAHPGYTLISTVAYMLILGFALVGVWLGFQRFALDIDRRLFYALTPFVFFGGALRVFEDANAAVYELTQTMVIPLPWVGLFISPVIYVTVFLLTLAAIAVGLFRRRRGEAGEPAITVAVIGSLLLLVVLAAIVVIAGDEDAIRFYPQVAIVTLGGATVIAAATWWFTERYRPEVNDGTGYVGVVIVWGHAVDGVANVLSIDWLSAIGVPGGYAPKHVVNRLVINLAETIQPAVVTDLIGTAWPFLALKIVVAVGVVWLFNEKFIEESPTYSYLLLIGVLAIGLGPGTRDFLRATLGL